MIAARLTVVPASSIERQLPAKPEWCIARFERLLMNGPGHFDRFTQLVFGRSQIGRSEHQQVAGRGANASSACQYLHVPVGRRFSISRMPGREPCL